MIADGQCSIVYVQITLVVALEADPQNAGFLVPTSQRGRKIGGALAKSFLEYGPKLGYRGSVFNLVFKSQSHQSYYYKPEKLIYR